jgi:reactive intermediate/imine deaminase
MHMGKSIIRTGEAPSAKGPYSQGVAMDGWVWTSGQVALDPATGNMVGADAADQALANIKAILHAAGAGLDSVVRASVYLTDMDDFSAVIHRSWCSMRRKKKRRLRAVDGGWPTQRNQGEPLSRRRRTFAESATRRPRPVARTLRLLASRSRT